MIGSDLATHILNNQILTGNSNANWVVDRPKAHYAHWMLPKA